ncbi:hypothetical protein DLH72_04800, partial [Candidatus Gracilibacteria bacterium]
MLKLPYNGGFALGLFLKKIEMQKYNDDCLNVFKKLESNSIDCCVTDCPYRIIAGGVRKVNLGDECSGILNKRDYSKTDPKGCLNRGVQYISDGTSCSNKWIPKNGNISSVVKDGKMFDFNDIKFSEWLPELYRVMKDGSHTYIFINSRNLKDLQVEAEKVGFIFQNLLVWEKGNFTPNKYYMQGVEFILLLRKGKAKNINNLGSKNIIKIPNIIGKKKHPTEKPVDIYKFLLENSTKPGDLVIDPFAGCGPIVKAGKELGLKVIAI